MRLTGYEARHRHTRFGTDIKNPTTDLGRILNWHFSYCKEGESPAATPAEIRRDILTTLTRDSYADNLQSTQERPLRPNRSAHS